MPQRHVLYLLICVGVIIAYGQRFGFNVALTAMTKPILPMQESEAVNTTSSSGKCVSSSSEEPEVSFPRETCLFYTKIIKIKIK